MEIWVRSSLAFGSFNLIIVPNVTHVLLSPVYLFTIDFVILSSTEEGKLFLSETFCVYIVHIALHKDEIIYHCVIVSFCDQMLAKD